jgi:hypothetical protein
VWLLCTVDIRSTVRSTLGVFRERYTFKYISRHIFFVLPLGMEVGPAIERELYDVHNSYIK